MKKMIKYGLIFVEILCVNEIGWGMNPNFCLPTNEQNNGQKKEPVMELPPLPNMHQKGKNAASPSKISICSHRNKPISLAFSDSSKNTSSLSHSKSSKEAPSLTSSKEPGLGFPKTKSLQTKEWQDILINGLDPFEKFEDSLNSLDTIPTSSSSSAEASDVTQYLPKSSVIEIDLEKRMVYIRVSSENMHSVFYPIFYRALFFQGTITKVEIERVLEDREYVHNLIKNVDVDWFIKAEDSAPIKVVMYDQAARDEYFSFSDKFSRELTKIKQYKKQHKGTTPKIPASKSLPSLENSSNVLPLMSSNSSEVLSSGRRVIFCENTTNENSNINVHSIDAVQPISELSDSTVEADSGNCPQQEEISYTNTDNPFVKFNEEKQIVLIQKLPSYKRYVFCPDLEEMPVFKLHKLIHLGIIQHFEIACEQLSMFSLPDNVYDLIIPGWEIDFCGISPIRVVPELKISPKSNAGQRKKISLSIKNLNQS